MKALQIANAQTMKIALQQEISRSDESRYDHRLHGVLLVCQGHSCFEVGQWLGEHPTTIERWVHRFEDGGFNALREGQREGRPRRWDDRTWENVERDLRAHPRDLGYNCNLWDGKLLAHHLQEKYQVSLGTRQCQRLFRSMGFRRRKPRPLIAQADPVAQEAFKKTRRAGKKSGAGSVEPG
jgi:transposase